MPIEEGSRCTVCIPTYNQSKYLRVCVESVAQQSAPVSLLVSNDCSPDDTADVLEKLQQRYRFRAVNHAENRGISKHLQWLLRQPDTPYLMRLDSDDYLHPDYIRELSALLDAHPKAGYAHCAVADIDGDGRRTGVRQLARTQVYEDAEDALRRSVQGYQVTANVVMFRREALLAVDFGGGVSHLDFVEDYDLSVRIADAGWGNVYCGKVLASYRTHAGPERPPVGRKLKEVVGLTTIFTGSLAAAFKRRGWDDAPLRRIRRQRAASCAEILDSGEFGPGERERMVEALVAFADDPGLRPLLADTTLARLRRTSITQRGLLIGGLKRIAKRVLFRR